MVQVLEKQGVASALDYDAYGYYGIPAEGWPTTGVFEFRDRIGDNGSSRYAPEAGRYHLYVAVGCPWAQRAAITVALMGLDQAISFSLVDDSRDGRGWAFRDRHGPDPVEGKPLLRDLYLLTEPSFRGHVNVPSLWDRKTRRIVNNDNDEIVIDLMTRFGAFAVSGLDLYPSVLRGDIDTLSAEIHEKLNIGVYGIGFSVEQSDYDKRVASLFELLDRFEARLSKSRFLFGDEITESDVRLWVSLARFDVVYNPLFRANLRRLVDYPHLWAYARDLYRLPAFSALTDFEAFKRAYYGAFPKMNPSGIIVAGPRPDWKASPTPDPVRS
jgi:putative glutathione S-transferase